jgi:hypothetical protein
MSFLHLDQVGSNICLCKMPHEPEKKMPHEPRWLLAGCSGKPGTM